MSQVCVITGGTSGIGRCTAQAMLARGYTVYELSRRAEGVAGMQHIVADVTKEETLAAAVAQILQREDHIDVLINNAGFGISGAVEFTGTEEAQRQLDVNFFGMVRMNRQGLPVMRKQGYGRIVNLSSVAGAIPIPFQTYYSASKAAINSYTMALANEVRPFGIQVCCVQPGDIRTGFTAAREKNQLGDDIYGGRIARSVSGMERDEQTGMAPEQAGSSRASPPARACAPSIPSVCSTNSSASWQRSSPPDGSTPWLASSTQNKKPPDAFSRPAIVFYDQSRPKFFLKTFRSSQLFAKATSAPPIRTQKIAVRKKKLVANRKSATGRRLSAAITRE